MPQGLLQAKVTTADWQAIHYLQQQQFQLVETEITFRLDLAKISVDRTACNCRFVTGRDLSQLHWVCEQFSQTRFRQPYFSLQENQRFYQQWLENAVVGVFDDACLLIVENEIPKGIVSLRLTKRAVQIGLLAVSPEFQGKGIGKKLLNSVVVFLQEKYSDQAEKIDFLLISTQLSNQRAMRLYQSFGAMLWHSAYWFYREIA
ncbi:hypothetical protein A6B43_05160 [Vespertiliibacter pulmonis]|nr:hypothetical protein A6B43_05160 [Vespertiliibacter pulmonis]